MQAEIAIEKNKNAKKEESQRQREKNQKSHIQMLLAMGVRDCPEQVEVYSQVMKSVGSRVF